MSDHPLLLGIDLGTSSVKAALYGLDGTPSGSAVAPYAIVRSRPGRAEQRPDGWWIALVDAARRALGAAARRHGSSGRRAQVTAIAVAGQMHGTVLVGRDHRPVGPAIIWSDQRAGDEAAAITDEIGADRLIRLAGGPLASGFQAATIRWLATHEPELLDKTASILCPKDYIRLRLTGELATDASDGSGTGFFNVADRAWAPDLVAASRARFDALPSVLESTAVAGKLLAVAARQLGLQPGTPVIVGGADSPVGLLASGLIRAQGFLLTISSGGQLMIPVGDPATDGTGRSHTFCSVVPPDSGLAAWYRMVAVLSAGLALQWLRDSVLELAGPDAYDVMLGWTDGVPVGSRGLVFLPYLAGERNPHLDPAARGVLLGLTAAHGRPELVRAVVEGITLGCLDAAHALWLDGRQPSEVIVAGGGGRNIHWLRIVADVFGLPVRRLETAEQAAAGACLLAGAGVGAFDLAETAARWARLGAPIQPDPRHHERYQAVFDVFRDGYPQLRGTFERLRSIGNDRASS